jgi:small subunit ribosomal protein S8
MTMTDPLGDMLTRIRNGASRRKSSVSTPASKLRERVLDVLQAEGYIRGYSVVDFGNGKSELSIELKYYEGASVIREIGRVSKPGRRVYVSVKSIPQVANGLGTSLWPAFFIQLPFELTSPPWTGHQVLSFASSRHVHLFRHLSRVGSDTGRRGIPHREQTTFAR